MLLPPEIPTKKLSQYAINKIEGYISTLREQLDGYLQKFKNYDMEGHKHLLELLNNKKQMLSNEQLKNLKKLLDMKKFSYLILSLKGNDIEWLTKLLIRPEVLSYLIHHYKEIPIDTHIVQGHECNYYLGISGFLNEGKKKNPRNIGLFVWTPCNTDHILITYPFFNFGLPIKNEEAQGSVNRVIHMMLEFLKNKYYNNKNRKNFFEKFVYKRRSSSKSYGNINNASTTNESSVSRGSSRKSSKSDNETSRSSRSSGKSSKSKEEKSNSKIDKYLKTINTAIESFSKSVNQNKEYTNTILKLHKLRGRNINKEQFKKKNYEILKTQLTALQGLNNKNVNRILKV
jgi:hypothetical protein